MFTEARNFSGMVGKLVYDISKKVIGVGSETGGLHQDTVGESFRDRSISAMKAVLLISNILGTPIFSKF